MTYINPINGYIPPATQVEREPAANKDRNARRQPKDPKDSPHEETPDDTTAEQSTTPPSDEKPHLDLRA